MRDNRNRVYVAGPLFNFSERAAQLKLAHLLESNGFQTFLPQRDGLEMARLKPYLLKLLNGNEERQTQLLNAAVACLDIYQVVMRCGSFVGNLNGAVLDDGTVAELVYASMAGRPTLFYRDDARMQIAGTTNPLVTAGAHSVVDEFESIPDALKKINDELPIFEAELPPLIQKKALLGEKFWDAFSDLREGSQSTLPDEKAEKIGQLILKVFNT